jgi:type II secretory ATPase GspE/PulE/Tfp pilus assembly ATPase PilB-like protein
MPLFLLPFAPLATSVEAGGYLNVWKTIPVLLILLVWTRLLTWIDKDSEAAYLPREAINGGFMGGAVLAFALFFFLPNFWLCLGVLVFIFAAEMGTYLFIRHKKVGLGDLKGQLKAAFTPKGKDKGHKTVAGEVGLIGKNGNVATPPLSESPEAAGYMAVQSLLSDPMIRGAEGITMAPADGVAQVRYVVDGFPYNGTSIAMDASQAGVSYLKQLAGLDLNERRKPQKGKIKAALGGVKHELELQTAGSAAGEFLKIQIDPKKRTSFRMEGLGFSEDQMAKMQALVADQGGIVLISAPKGQGLTSTIYGILRAHDAFLTHIHTVERAPEEDIEGITQNTISANATPDEEYKQVSWVISQEPDMVVVTLLESPKSAQELVNYASNGKRVYVGLRAGSTFQALEQWRKLVGDDAAAMKDLRMVISGRVMRRLCNACKVAYAPDPDTVRKLNLDPGKVTNLFMPRKEPMRDQKGNPILCDFCKELRYKGRFGVFEILDVDKDVKQIVSGGGSVNQLKAVFRKQRGRFLQEVALAQITEGETSVQEMVRVLRADEGAAPPAAAASGGGAAAAGPARPRPSSSGGGSAPASSPRAPSSSGGGKPPARKAPGT